MKDPEFEKTLFEATFKSAPRIDFDEATKQRGDLISSFIDTLTPNEKARAYYHAESLQKQGETLPSFIALTPIAAHQEEPTTILHAVSEYAKQKEAGPFMLILGLNYPSSERNNPLIEQNRDAVAVAKEQYPQLDVRVIEQSYPGKTTIGRIRRDIWNSAVILGEMHNKEHEYREFIGLNQDIDLVTLSPHFIKSAKEFYLHNIQREMIFSDLWARGSSYPIYSNAKHAYNPEFPNVSHAVFWHEFARSQDEGNLFEAGAMIPFIYYAKNGGISNKLHYGEVNSLMDKGGFRSPIKLTYTSLNTVHAETNIRRYAQSYIHMNLTIFGQKIVSRNTISIEKQMLL
jgi:hypothetical protein